ncbi:hypothetical protein C437_15386 [Haloarcula vallismortis ATCC 29715]|uniref:Uncharacterized protein n=1 Tax=Haloarcula vallismortis ATCC 29715 TaxID=662477 RepID=M0J249_HALVA|nr:hypothetical protein [Haloarcula vallismortis]EMA01815.1 hypothetical protein C437_15386 [Haloarcula vallismortis ATCC 29715]
MADGDSGRMARLLDGSETIPALGGFKKLLEVVKNDDGTMKLVNLGENSFPLASGVKWTRLGAAIIGSTVAIIATGVSAIVQGAVEAATRYLEAIQSFFFGGTEPIPDAPFLSRPSDGLYQVTVDAGIAAIRGAWSFSLAEFGVLALPISIIVVLATFYVVSAGIDFLKGRYL